MKKILNVLMKIIFSFLALVLIIYTAWLIFVPHPFPRLLKEFPDKKDGLISLMNEFTNVNSKSDIYGIFKIDYGPNLEVYFITKKGFITNGRDRLEAHEILVDTKYLHIKSSLEKILENFSKLKIFSAHKLDDYFTVGSFVQGGVGGYFYLTKKEKLKNIPYHEVEKIPNEDNWYIYQDD